MFQDENDIKILYEKMEDLVNHIELQAEMGIKFLIATEPAPKPATYNMFVNELILGDNTFFGRTG